MIQFTTGMFALVANLEVLHHHPHHSQQKLGFGFQGVGHEVLEDTRVMVVVWMGSSSLWSHISFAFVCPTNVL